MKKAKHLEHHLTIGLVGKYVQLHDAYLSVHESLKHAGLANNADITIRWINSEDMSLKDLEGVDGIIVPGGFGGRGVEGMINASKYARENNIPYFGICLGMQIASIDIARHLANIEGANSQEWQADTQNPIISLMADQNDVTDLGGTLRLGNWPCHIEAGSKVASLYGETEIVERHRHRYEFNNDYRKPLNEVGVKFSGVSPDNKLVEIIDIRTTLTL